MKYVESTQLLLDSNRGVYIPRAFVHMYGEQWGVKPEQIAKLSEDPYGNDWFWDTWAEVTDNCTYTDEAGNVFRLHQDGDLWAYCLELMTEEERDNFFGPC